MSNCTTRGNPEHWHSQWQQLYGMRHTVARTIQHEETVWHAATVADLGFLKGGF